MSTKRCPKCGDDRLALFTSLRLKYCNACSHWMNWDLSPGQKPLVGPARSVRKEKP